MLAIQNPLEDDSTTKNKILFNMDMAITTIFTAEVFIKIITHGLIING